MKNLIGVTTSYINAIPVPEDGIDFDTAGSLEGGFQQLTNNVATEKLVLDTFVATKSAASGLAALSAGSKLIAAQTPDRLMGVSQCRSTVSRVITATSYAALPTNGVAVQFTGCEVGDLFEVDHAGVFSLSSTNQEMSIAAKLRETAMILVNTESLSVHNGDPKPFARSGIYVLTAGDIAIGTTFTWELVARVTGGNATVAVNHYVKARHIRPTNFTPSSTAAGA